jgi:hypothetical protein
MRLDRMRHWWQGRESWEKLAIGVWLLVLLGIAGRLCLWPHKSAGVYPIFANAAQNWWEGADLYFWDLQPSVYDHFRYSPLVAAALSPLAILPERIGAVIWRLINAGIYLAALAWWGQAVLLPSLTRRQTALLFLLVVPLSIGSLNNGQSNPLVIGCLLAGAAAAATERWNLAAVAVAVACLFKLYPLAVALLLIAVYPRRFTVRFVLAMAAGLALPYLFQHPAYVTRQYANWLQLLRLDDRSNWQLDIAYRDLWLLIRVYHIPISLKGYLAIQLGTAACAALLCLAGRLAGWSPRKLLTALLNLGVCWMILCGPATESSTYILFAPVLAWAVLDAHLRSRGVGARTVALTAFGLCLVNDMASWFPFVKTLHAWGPKPMAALLIFSYVLAQLVHGLVRAPAISDSEFSLPTARAA